MTRFVSLKNHLLIAMPNLDDPNFNRSVTLICEHNEDGAMGIVVNHPTDVATSELLEHLEIVPNNAFIDRPVLAGGPVQVDTGFVVHQSQQDWQSSIIISDQITVTTSLDVMKAFANDRQFDRAFVALGYAGWGPGQLEEEILENAWLSVPAAPEILFEVDVEDRWSKAVALLGINIHQLSSLSGHS